MSLSGPDWVKLNRLLDQALDLTPAERSQWMESLPAEYASLRDTLRDVLLRDARLETSEVLRRAPSFAHVQGAALASGDLVGAYRLLRPIGSGGMSTVWLAERSDGTLRRKVALKLPRMLAIDGQRLTRERDILASLEHPGIARLYDAGVDAVGRPFLAIEYVEGVPLDRYVDSRTHSTPQRLQLFLQVARAVAHAHARLIVHQDLKPANVMVNNDGQVLLLDFGIAHLLQADAAEKPGSVRAFTPRYAAPEQFEGQPATVATDIYSLGVMLYELLARTSPYPLAPSDGLDAGIVCLGAEPIVARVDRSTARALRGDLDAIVRKALQLRPVDRYESVGALIDDIERCLQHQPVRAHRDTLAYRASKFVRRHRAATALASALLIAIVGGAALSVQQARTAAHERDRAVRLFQQADATSEFWSMVFTQGVGNDEAISMPMLLKRSGELAERAFDKAPLQYSVAVEGIAALYISHGLPGEAESLLARAIARTQSLDEGYHRTASLQCKYAMTIAQLGRVAEAEDILARVIAAASDQPDLQQYCLHRRSIVARDNNDAAGALEYILGAVRLHRSSPVQLDHDTAQLLGDLGYAYVLNGQPDLAERYYEESMRLYEKVGRQESAIALTVLNNWGVLAISTGNPAVALEKFDRAVEVARRRSPEGEPPPYLLGNRANSLLALARLDEAAQAYERVAVRSVRDGNTRMLTYALAGAAEVEIRWGNAARAQELLERVRAQAGKGLKDRSPAALKLMVVQGRVWALQGRREEAIASVTKAIDSFDEGRVADGGVALVIRTRAELLLEDARFEEAARDARRAASMARAASVKGRHSAAVGLTQLTHARVQLRQNEPAAARESTLAAVEHLEKTLGADHPDTRSARAILSSLSMT